MIGDKRHSDKPYNQFKINHFSSNSTKRIIQFLEGKKKTNNKKLTILRTKISLLKTVILQLSLM